MNDFEIQHLRIAEIRIGDRHRKDFGDLKALAASIGRGRLLQPIGVTPGMELIWGCRRLLAHRDILTLETIPARVVRVSSIAQGEFDENVIRKDYTVSERVAIVDSLRGCGHGGDRKSDQRRKCDVEPLTVKGAAARVGFCRDDYFRAKQVVDAASQEPEKYGRLVDRMDKTGRIAGACRELRISRELEKIRSEPQPLPEGPFRVCVIDPAWEYEEGYSLSRRGVTPYPVMTIEEIKAMPLPTIMHEDSVVWMWTTNRHLASGEACEILKHWGFRPVTILTWDKERPGTGVWLIGQTEHAILAVRGKPVMPIEPPITILRAARPSGHSTKPDAFFELVERLGPGSRVEIFARRERPGWACWGSELWAPGEAKPGDEDATLPDLGLEGGQVPETHSQTDLMRGVFRRLEVLEADRQGVGLNEEERRLTGLAIEILRRLSGVGDGPGVAT